MKNYTLSQVMKKFLSPMMENKKLLYIAIFYFLVDSLTSVGLLYSFKEIVDNINGGINFYFYLFLIFVVLKFFEVIYFRNFFGIFYPEMRKYFYSKYLTEFLKLDNNYTETQGTGKIISIIDKSNMVWLEQLTAFFENFLSGFFNALFSLFIVFFINIYYGIILVILVSFVFLIATFVQKINREYRIKRREINIDISRKIVGFIMSKFEILQNSKGDKEIEKIKANLDINKSLNRKMSSNYVYFDLFSNFIVLGTRIFLIILFLFGFDKGIISLGDFVALVSFSYILESSLKSMIGMYMNFSNSLVDIEKVWEFFDGNSKIVGYDEFNEFKHKNGNIEIKNLDFYYYEGKNIFKNFNLNIEGGKITAFVGNSGSGKTTLVKLIAGYIKPISGEIIIDSQKLSETSLKSYYKNIGYLTQDPSVFDGTIIENLTYAIDSQVSKDDLDKVIKDSNCEFIYDLPAGLETEIGERGVRLSGGQKQRLAIAKIMLKNPSIIILDEPTSALDSFSEEQITKALNNLFVGKTVIIIAHRLQTVKHADKIIVFQDGEVVESGNHENLVNKKGIYSKMLELQSGF